MGKNIQGKVVCAMSGGVDSSVAAALLIEQGYEVIGCFLRLGNPPGVGESDHDAATPTTSTTGRGKQGCCSVLDAADARRVASILGVSFYVLNFQDDFGRIVDYFVGEYNAGRTPNPCVRCNDWLKFGRLAQYAAGVGADFVASGHYARTGVDPQTGAPCLMRGVDHRKDQSYVLFGMKPQTIAHTLLPIGGIKKPQVRAIAERLKLPTFNKPDSQEICFVPDQDYAGLLRRRTPESFRTGRIIDESGVPLGEHAGHQHFTIGQRKGVGVAAGVPLYVIDIRPQTGEVVVGSRDALLKRTVIASQINLPVSRPQLIDGVGVRCEAKIRYNHTPQPAVLRRTGDDQIQVTFDQPQSAITPGQAVVCYDGEVVLGGGWIDRAE